jgi:hypothetical protein
VTVTGTAGATPAAVALTVSPQALNCGTDFSYVAPVASLTDRGLKPGSDVTVTDTVPDLPSTKGAVVCYQPIEASPPPPAFLKKCLHGAHLVAPCYQSISEVSGSVVITLELPTGDPRFHVGAETPSVASVSPTLAKPGKKLTIKGENLSEVTGVTIGRVPAQITATAPTKVTVNVPAGSEGGVVVVSSSAGVAVGPSVTVSAARIRLLSSKPRRYEHRRR